MTGHEYTVTHLARRKGRPDQWAGTCTCHFGVWDASEAVVRSHITRHIEFHAEQVNR